MNDYVFPTGGIVTLRHVDPIQWSDPEDVGCYVAYTVGADTPPVLAPTRPVKATATNHLTAQQWRAGRLGYGRRLSNRTNDTESTEGTA